MPIQVKGADCKVVKGQAWLYRRKILSLIPLPNKDCYQGYVCDISGPLKKEGDTTATTMDKYKVWNGPPHKNCADLGYGKKVGKAGDGSDIRAGKATAGRSGAWFN
eukprot:NODE_4864_length_443_cov_238.918782_g4206_i0.p1 GENE.NODE_4864_length_443_cov_238.918782_g4206_i0~~NODE_4864_length_443_cov_238.918782_g4206_i0.p1  ORF type:complete len:124 (+),score=42.87 NODE_4864_length_443_cov_238.918782_g4206_i0:55-372(+)